MSLNRATSAPPLRRCGISLRRNGYDLSFDDSGAWEAPVVALIEHQFTEEDFAALLRPHVVPRD
jgi:hypothetical protein